MNSLAKVHTKQNLFSFTEKDPGQTVGSRGFDDPTISRTDVGAFSDFFSRPIRLREYEVLEGTDFTTQFLQPWNEYFTNAQMLTN